MFSEFVSLLMKCWSILILVGRVDVLLPVGHIYCVLYVMWGWGGCRILKGKKCFSVESAEAKFGMKLPIRSKFPEHTEYLYPILQKGTLKDDFGHQINFWYVARWLKFYKKISAGGISITIYKNDRFKTLYWKVIQECSVVLNEVTRTCFWLSY